MNDGKALVAWPLMFLQDQAQVLSPHLQVKACYRTTFGFATKKRHQKSVVLRKIFLQNRDGIHCFLIAYANSDHLGYAVEKGGPSCCSSY